MLVFTAITSGMWQDIMAEYTFMIKYNQQTRMEHGSLITLYSTDHLTEQNVFMIIKVDRKNFIISRIKVASLSLVCTKGSIGLLNLGECCLSWVFFTNLSVHQKQGSTPSIFLEPAGTWDFLLASNLIQEPAWLLTFFCLFSSHYPFVTSQHFFLGASWQPCYHFYSLLYHFGRNWPPTVCHVEPSPEIPKEQRSFQPFFAHFSPFSPVFQFWKSIPSKVGYGLSQGATGRRFVHHYTIELQINTNGHWPVIDKQTHMSADLLLCWTIHPNHADHQFWQMLEAFIWFYLNLFIHSSTCNAHIRTNHAHSSRIYIDDLSTIHIKCL